jgi:hypothetical protein
MKMRIPILLAVVVSAVVVVALMGGAVAGAGTPSLIQLKVGDTVDVLNARVVCFALNSNGKTGIGCLIWGKKNAPLVGSYGVGLSVDGTAVLNRIKADGSAQNLFRKRLLASRGAAGTVYKVKVGEGFGLPAPNGRVLGCQVLNIKSTALAPIYRGLKVSCWLATATKPVPNRYGVSISDKMAGVFKFTPKGALSSWGIVKPQPKG